VASFAGYADDSAAMSGIAKFLSDFYSSRYSQGGQALRSAIAEVQHMYAATIFPFMKVDWRTHPNDIGHYYAPGCFRCHDGQHVSAMGRSFRRIAIRAIGLSVRQKSQNRPKHNTKVAIRSSSRY
jgi:hypothetical protein